MCRKLVLAALVGIFALGMAAQGMAVKTGGPPAYKTSDGNVTSDWPGVKGSNAEVWMKKQVKGGCYDNEAAPGVKSGTSGGYKTDAYSDGAKKVSHSGYYLYDSRDPQNGVIRPGGRVIRP